MRREMSIIDDDFYFVNASRQRENIIESDYTDVESEEVFITFVNKLG